MNILIPTSNYLSKEVPHYAEISQFTTDFNCTRVHLKNGESLMFSDTLKSFEKFLKDSNHFESIFRSYLVNTHRINHRSTCEVMLTDGLVLLIARRR